MPESLITEEQLKQIMEQQNEKIKERIEQTVTNTVVDRLNWQLTHKVDELIDKFFEEEIAPQVSATLTKNKDVIIEELSKVTIDVSGLLVQSLVERATKNLSGYQGSDIVKKLFG